MDLPIPKMDLNKGAGWGGGLSIIHMVINTLILQIIKTTNYSHIILVFLLFIIIFLK